MKVHLFKSRKKSERTGFWNTSFYVQGVGLSGLVPVKVSYFGEPVMEPVMEPELDSVGKPKKDKDGKPILVEKKDKDGNVILQEKVDEKGEKVLRDNEFSIRQEILDMYSADLRTGAVCDPVDVIAKKQANSDEFNYFVICGDVKIPVEVPDFSTDERPDYSFRANKEKLRIIATR